MDPQQELRRLLETCSSAPVLFVGSGLSRRYLGTPDWRGLLAELGAALPGGYDRYRLSAAPDDLPGVATAMVAPYFEFYERHLAGTEPYFPPISALTNQEAALKHGAAALVNSFHTRIDDPALTSELALLEEADIDAVITTNYESLMESVYPESQVYIGQEQLFVTPLGVGETYKIHGCTTMPESMVLTAADYQSYRQKRPYLVAKLMTMFVEHPVFFLGYRLQDRNIGDILDELGACLSADDVSAFARRMVFVEWIGDQANPILTQAPIRLATGATVEMTLVRTASFEWLFEELASRRRQFPVVLLRRLKEHVYSLVHDTKPTATIHVVPLDDGTIDPAAQMVIGVGMMEKLAELGHVGVLRDQVFDDVIEDQSSLDAKVVLAEVIPRWFKKRNSPMPVFRYLRATDRIDSHGNVSTADLPQRTIDAICPNRLDYLPSNQYYRNKGGEEVDATDRVPALRARYGETDAAYYLSQLDYDEQSIDELRAYLVECREALADHGRASEWRRLVRLYDLVAFGPPAARMAPRG